MSNPKSAFPPGQAGPGPAAPHAPIIPIPITRDELEMACAIIRIAEGRRVAAGNLARLDVAGWRLFLEAVKARPEGPERLGVLKSWPNGTKGQHRNRIRQAIAEARSIVLETPDDPDPDRDFDPNLPMIIMGTERPDEGFKTWTPEALNAIRVANKPPTLYQQDGSLVRLKPGDDDRSPSIVPHGNSSFRGYLDRIANWGVTVQGRKGKSTRWGIPPGDLVKDIMSLLEWDQEIIPHLSMVVEAPRFLPNGRLMIEPGYHADGRIYYSPPPALRGLVIPERPTEAEVEWAKSLIIDDAFHDFPFKNQASRANAVALMLLPFVRLAIDGATPLHMIEASTPGTGKGKLANLCAYPALGRDIVSSPQKESDEEYRKALTSAFLSGQSHIFLDNLNNALGWDGSTTPIDSGALAAALTQRYWSDRLLGSNTQTYLRIDSVWIGSGNNVEFSTELTRRLVLVTLLTTEERPGDRTGFKHDPLEAWLEANRRELLVACLILCSNWYAMGCPVGSENLASYEVYARTMGGILKACGIPGFLANRPRIGVTDRTASRWSALVEAWSDAFGTAPVSTGQLYELINGDGSGSLLQNGIPELQVAFVDILGSGNVLSQKQRMGKEIGRHMDRIYATHRVVLSTAKGKNGATLYRLAHKDEPVVENVENDA